MKSPLALGLVCLAALTLVAPPAPALAADTKAAGVSFPLDALTEAEINETTALLKADARFPKDGLFVSMDLHEPAKKVVYNFHPGDRIQRQIEVVIYSRGQHKGYEGLVDATGSKILYFRPIIGAQPMVLGDEYDRATSAVRKDPRFIAAMKRRGIDPAETFMDGWAAGPLVGAKRRVLRALTFYKGKNIIYYGRPIEGVQALVDVDTQEVLKVSDTGVVPVPEHNYDLSPEAIGKQRPALKPLIESQPEGPEYKVNGGEISWQGWHFRISFHQREGLVLHNVGFEKNGKVHPILYRAGLAEMMVPYGDPDPNWNWRAAFDVGEYGFGNLTSPLVPGNDAPDGARYFDATFADTNGKPYVYPRVVGLYERDGGVLWKHYDYFSGKSFVRRARDLVLTTSAAIGNYDYIMNWIFHQDGILEQDAIATGMLLAKGTAEETSDGKVCTGCTSHLVDKRTLAPNHQHFMNFRLDFDVDGTNNTVSELNQRALPKGRGNPMGNGFEVVETVLGNEDKAQRDLSPNENRVWRIFNPSVHNSLGNNSGYMLMPITSTPPYIYPTAAARQRAHFVDHALWVTRFHPNERFAAGMYPNQASQDRGLKLWANDHEPLENKDVVVWYTMGMSHHPREEEWPIMNATHMTFKLLPMGFFDRNPAMDVPPVGYVEKK